MNFITADLGGTNTRIARANSLNQARFTDEPIRRQNTHQYKNDLGFIIETARLLSENEPIDALGIGMPGRIDDSKTDMVSSNNLPEWANQHALTTLSQTLNCPVYLDNDGVTAGLGEGYFGQIKSDFDYLIWGTGIGCVNVIHAQDGDIEASYTRRRYHAHFEAWEQDCGGAHLKHAYGKTNVLLSVNEWEIVHGRFTQYLKQYIEMAAPTAIVVGGGLAVHHAKFLHSLAGKVTTPLMVTTFGEDSGLVGGLALIRQRGKNSPPTPIL